MVFDKPIIIEKLNEESGKWIKYISLHAHVNKHIQKEEFKAGATKNKRTLKFEVRYCSPLKNIEENTQIYRIIYKNKKYNITDTDDFEERHQNFKMFGVSY
ncbi:phage head closure protein [Thomasclavelia cocleata]|uniref:phage head closure protein n=1 Tax=Thomasclavelia cocleata TaxID=69824 RepID=UPI00242F0D2B|nr:phage head closure protein [Thomasclavelia cocleata]